ncbi:MAG: sodium:proton antiporter [Phycisphaerales bacterium]
MTGPSSTHEHDAYAPRAAQPSVAHGVCFPIVAWGWIGTAGLLGVALLGFLASAATTAPAEHHAGAMPAAWWIGCAPFVLLILAIAVFPLVPPIARWWHHNANKLAISLVAAFATLAYVALTASPEAATTAARGAVVLDFVPFILLLFALYVVSGGIHLEGDLIARPSTTTGLLALGAAIASVVGTTGASMLLIRPLLSTISERRHRVHTVIFFIFLVSNIGGTLLPIGDPPLFMGFLRGVPFWWTLSLWKEWLFCCATLLVLHYVIDRIAWSRETAASRLYDRLRAKPLRLVGGVNLLWLALVILTVAFVDQRRELPFIGVAPPPFAREAILIGLSALSVLTTPRSVREANRFSYGAIGEVAAVFIGIFVSMHVPLELLNEHGGALGITTPGQFFWATGMLSSFLDNAPTYVVFLQAADVLPDAQGVPLVTLTDGNALSEPLLAAVSLGAVFMGANTYIGNGPNFMVRSIADESGVRMPSFFGYMLWSIGILVPLFLLVHLLFLAP